MCLTLGRLNFIKLCHVTVYWVNVGLFDNLNVVCEPRTPIPDIIDIVSF